MKIKGKEKITKYKYLVMFDLASHVTGICLWDIQKHSPISTQIIKVPSSCESKVLQLGISLKEYFETLVEQGIDLKEILVYKEAMPTQVHGGSSTIQTFIALAKSHAVLELFLSQNNIDSYDDIGVYPASTHAHFRHLLNLEAKEKVDKEKIREYVLEKYNLSEITFDESDAIFLAQTFVESKWNKDIQEEIREIKRHKKTLKAQHAIIECDNKITFLESLKI